MRLAPSRLRYTIAFLAVPTAVAAIEAVRRRKRRYLRETLEIERERAFLRSIIEHAPIGLAALDARLRFVWANQALADKRGWPPGRFVGHSLGEVFTEAGVQLEPDFQEMIGREACVRFKEVPYRRSPDVPMHYCDVTGISLVDPKGFNGLLLITQDITERVEQLQKLQEVDKLKDLFLSTISHELKTPLSLITGYAELLEDKYPDETLLQGVMDGSRRLVAHLNAVIDYSALLSGSLPLYKTDFCPDEVVEQAIAMLEEDIQRKDQHLHVEIVPDGPPLYGDIKRITQVLIELLDNARKQTPPHGHLGVTVAREGDEVRFTVWDTGRGIAPEKFSRIWEAFSQLDAEDAHRRGGLGLGLTIVKALTELHQGRTEVESHPGQGCRFSVYLPARLG